MTDRFTKEQRSKMMKSVRSKSKLEDQFFSILWSKGVRFRRNTKDLFGMPDLSIKKYKIVIFIDSCFWHMCPLHSTLPQSNAEFWEKKLQRNKQRDKEVSEYYLNNHWNLLRIWEHEIKNDLSITVKQTIEFIEHSKKIK